jgi:hypothetical protein
MFAEGQPAETGTDHNDMRFFASSHTSILKQRAQKATRLV